MSTTRLGMPGAQEHAVYGALRRQFALANGIVLRSGVGEADYDDALLPAARGGTDVSPTLTCASVIDWLLARGAARVPFRTRMLVSGQPFLAGWYTHGKAIRVAADSLVGTALEPRRSGVIGIVARETFADGSVDLARLMQRNLTNAVDDRVNRTFCDPYAAGDADSPSGIAYGISGVTIDSAGATLANIATDFEAAIRECVDAGSDGRALVAVVHTRSAVNLATMRTTGGEAAFPEMTPAGGRACGIPVFATSAMPNTGSPTSTQLMVLDASDIVIAEEAARAALSDETMVEMDDAPTGDTSTPAAASAHRVSMFQADVVAVRVTRPANWHSRRGILRIVEGVQW